MSDFSDRPFVAGSLIGLRAFSIDDLGRLLGPSYGQVFKPGENEAECRKGPYTSMTAMLNSFSASMSKFYYLPSLPGAPTESEPETYGKGPCPCGCGTTVEFHDGTTERKKPAPAAPTASEIEAAVDLTPLVNTVEHTLGGVDCTCGFYAYFDGRNDYKDPSRIAAIVEGYGVCTVGARGFRASKARLVALVEPKGKVSPMLQDYLHRNYPDVPFYATRSEAITAHPLSPPGSDVTPADDDFWSREVPR